MAAGRVFASSRQNSPGQTATARRALTAFWLGAAISVAGLAGLAANGAGARGPFTAANPTSFASPPSSFPSTFIAFAPPRTRLRLAEAEPPRRKHSRITFIGGHAKTGAPISYVGSGAVCVRLCDGAFFPLDTAAGDGEAQATACGALCPDAPTEVYYRNNSDRIGDAISAHGERYSALPVALRYQKTSDATCACHRDLVAYAPLNDATLRRGDAIMTPAGVVVFRGAEGAAHRPGDFTAMANVNLSWPKRAEFQALERVSVAKNGPTLREWMASQTAPILALRRAPSLAARVSRGDDSKIRVLVWRGARED